MTKKGTILILLLTLVLVIAVARINRTVVPALRPVFSDVDTNKIESMIPLDAFVPVNGVDTFLSSNERLGVSIFAKNLINPRELHLDNEGRMLVSSNKFSAVLRLSDTDEDGFAETQEELLTNQDRPHGLLLHDKYLYVAEEEQVSRYIYGDTLGPQELLLALPRGGRHFTRSLAVRGDKLYISVGSSCDTCIESDERYASVLEANLDGSNSRVYAHGLRNAVFIKLRETTGELFATEMGRDHLGDKLPPDEINIIKENKGYGWPFCYGQQVYDAVFNGIDNCSLSESSLINLPAHVSPLGFAFIPESWGQEYAGDLLVAYHGSWNSTVPVGYRIERFEQTENGFAQQGKSFIEGFLDTKGNAQGRPVDLVFSKDGTMFFSDDKGGFIYAIRKLE